MQKILVIDDDAFVRITMARLLQRQGYEVASAKDGEEGLAVFRAESPDLVITDIIMPGTQGIEMIQQMRRERPGAKIIAVSGGGRVGTKDYLEMARQIGASDVIAKPFDPDDFINRVKRCLAAG